jgi:hypothetical protein
LQKAYFFYYDAPLWLQIISNTKYKGLHITPFIVLFKKDNINIKNSIEYSEYKWINKEDILTWIIKGNNLLFKILSSTEEIHKKYVKLLTDNDY